MRCIGEIQVNYDALEDLFKTIITCLAGESSQLAVWLLDDQLDLSSIQSQTIGSSSPFVGSNSRLAGSGCLIPLTAENVKNVLDFFTDNSYLGFEVLHFEIGSNGTVQFAAYDHFCAVFFGEMIALERLEYLKRHEVIESYTIYDAEP